MLVLINSLLQSGMIGKSHDKAECLGCVIDTIIPREGCQAL